MKTQLLGTSGILSTRLAYGCMRIAGSWWPDKVTQEGRETGREAVLAAWEAGYRLFDHADIYCRGVCEEIYGDVVREMPEMREAVVATKCGIRFPGDPTDDAPKRFDFSREHIVWSCEQSLRRLGLERIDLYQLHRPDVLMDPDEVADAFSTLRRAGKVREFGVSNFTPSQVDALQSRLPFALIVNQIQIHADYLGPFEDGTLDQCLAQGITPLAWSPVAKGMLADGGSVPENHRDSQRAQRLIEAMDRVAGAHGVGRTVIALAWLMRHPTAIIPIVGSTNPDRIRQATAADDVELTREQWYEIYIASRGRELP